MPAFFGLTASDKEAVILEPFFALTYYCGMMWETYMDFPVAYKRWLINRVQKEITAKAEDGNDIPHKGFHGNTRDVRELTGKTRTSPTDSRRQRFT